MKNGCGCGLAGMKRSKPSTCEAKRALVSRGIDPDRRDYFELRMSEAEQVLAVAKAVGYRKRKDAPGSTGRMFFQHLRRKKC